MTGGVCLIIIKCYIVLNKRTQVATVEKKFKEIYSPHADGDYAETQAI
jgi:hypothetical protein